MDKKTYRSEKLAERKNSTNFRPNIQNCSSALIQSDDVLTEKELNEALRKSGKDTAAGPDRIRYPDIKNLTEEDRAELYTIYQESFHKGYIPEDWTGSFFKPIPKSGKDHHKLNGCRKLLHLICISYTQDHIYAHMLTHSYTLNDMRYRC